MKVEESTECAQVMMDHGSGGVDIYVLYIPMGAIAIALGTFTEAIPDDCLQLCQLKEATSAANAAACECPSADEGCGDSREGVACRVKLDAMGNKVRAARNR